MASIQAFLILFAASACAHQDPPQKTPSGVDRISPLASPSAVGPPQQASGAAQELQQWYYPDGRTRWGILDGNTGIMKPDPQAQQWYYPDGSIRWGVLDRDTGIIKPAPQAQQWYYPDGSIRWGIYDHNTGIMKELSDR